MGWKIQFDCPAVADSGAGASQPVSFTLTPEDVGFYDNAAEFRVEPGGIEVYVGTGSAATLTAKFTVG